MIIQKLRRAVVALSLTAAAWVVVPEPASAIDLYPISQNDLFYNYYNNNGAVGAQLYPAPQPVPPHVGHTWYTYQPLMPHEFMYPHYRTYRRFDRPLGVIPRNTTRVVWW